MNKYKTVKKVGEEKYDHYGHPTAVIRRLLRSLCSRVAIVGGKKVLKKVGMMGVVMISILSMALAPVGFWGPVKTAQAATYTFTQTDWVGGATSTAAVHGVPTPGQAQGNWTYASTTDSNIATSTAGRLTLKATVASAAHTSDADFSGTNSTTTIRDNSVKLSIDAGTGLDGAYSCDSGICSLSGGTYNYSSFTVAANATTTITGANPLIIKVKGEVTINGVLTADGGNANAQTGGTGVGGGGNGGNGAPYGGTGVNGAGDANGAGKGGTGGDHIVNGGGGGGFGGNGGDGGQDPQGGTKGAGGTAYGAATNGGSGGGGGGEDDAYIITGRGGGAGGGAISIVSSGNITVGGTGKITANGGNGAGLNDYGAGGGGGGSGGGIRLEAVNIVNSGSITANGGSGGNVDDYGEGGGGGGGRIALYDSDASVGGTITANGGTVPPSSIAIAGSPASPTASAISSYALSGVYTSSVINTGQKNDFTTLTYNKTANASTTVTIDIRAGNTEVPDGSWTSWQTNISSGGSISALNGYQYIQYRANLSTTDATYTPSLDDITINYQYYPTAGIQSGLATVDYNSTTNYLCDGAGCPSASSTISGGTAKLLLPTLSEITPDANTKGLWHLNTNNNSDATAADSAGTNTATLYASSSGANTAISQMWDANGRLGSNTYKAIEFDGVDDYVDAGGNADLPGGWGAITLEAWIKLGAIDANYHNIIDKRTSPGGTTAYALQLEPSGGGYRAKFVSSAGSRAITSTSTSMLITDTANWHHIAFTYGGTNDCTSTAGARIYIDGILETNYTCTNDGGAISSVDTNPLKIGARGSDNLMNFNGLIDEVAVWDMALSAATIASHAGVNYIPSSGSQVTSPSQSIDSRITAYTSFSETATTPSGTSVDYQVSTNSGTTWKYWNGSAWATAGALNWNASSTINTNIGSLATSTGDSFKVKARLTTTAITSTPELDNISVGYNYDTSVNAPALISSAYDSSSGANAMGSLSWDESLLSASTTATVSLRTASTSDLLVGATWYDFSSSTAGCANASGTITCSSSALNTVSSGNLTNGVNDQWWQYKITLSTTNSGQTPTVTEARVQYVVNAPPAFNSSSASQGSSGSVTINYNIYDTDTDQGSAGNQYKVTPSFEYSTNTVDWFAIATSSGALTNYQDKGVGTSTAGTATSTSWNAEATLGSNTYTTTGKIRITLNDHEAANNTAATTTASFTIDTKDPAGGTLLINGSNAVEVSTSSVSVSLSGLSDDSQVYIQLSNDGANWYGANANGTVSGTADTWGTATSTGATLGTWQWTLPTNSRTHTLYANIKDIYGNQVQRTATAEQNASPVVSISNAPSISTTASTTPGVIIVNYDLSDPDSSGVTPADTSATTTLMVDLGVTLNTALNDAIGTSVVVAGLNKSAIAANDIIQIENELMKVTANSGGTLTVARGFAGSRSATHPTTGVAVWIMAKNPTGACANSQILSGACAPLSHGTGKTISWTPANDITATSSAAKLKVTAIDGRAINQTGSGDSSAFFFDTVKPVNASPRVVEFDAGVAGTVGANAITIYHPTDATGTQYLFSATTTDGAASTTSWTTLSGAGPTYLSWGFDSATTSKSVNIKFRDIYGNTQVATTTVSTIAPLDPDAFMVQDTSNVRVAPAEYREYISWQASASTDFYSYKFEYATSSAASATGCSNATYGNYADVTTITASSTNYYTHLNLTTGLCYKYRVGVKDVNNNITIRSSAGTIGYPDGLQNAGEGGGGTATSPTASIVTNVVPTQGADGNVSVSYTLTDSSLSAKTSPAYEGYIFYNIGTYLTASSTNTLTLSDTSKLPLTNGYIQINQEIIGYTANATSTGTLSGITRGTWPTFVSSGRTTRVNTVMASSTSVWIMATSTGASITNTSISSGQNGSLSWNPRSDSALNGNYLSGVGIRVLVHDNQSAGSGPISSQSDSSVDSTLAILDLKAPVLGASSLLINGSASSVENASSTAALSLTGVSGDTSSETINIQFATSSNWFGALSGGTISATSSDWGDAASVGGNLGPWTWPLSGRSETVSVRMKDAYGNVSNTDTNSILKNAVPEFYGSISDSDAAGYATTTNNNIVIRQCNIYDTDPLCTAGKVKVKFLARDADTAQGVTTPGYIHADFSFSLNSGAYATSAVVTYSATGTNALAQDAQTGTSTVALDGATYTTVTAYYDPGISSSATFVARVSVTDNENGTTPVTATSNTISYDKTAPSGSLTFDAGIAGSSTTAVITIPLPTDANAVQYKLTDDSATHSSASSTAWTSFASATTSAWTFDSDIEGKVLNYLFRDIYGNQSGTGTASSLAPPTGSSFTVDDISTGSNKRTYLSWAAATSSDFAMYRLEYATSSDSNTYTNYSELVTLSSISINYYTHAGLDSGTWYRYRLSVKNLAGNYSVKTLKNSNSYITAKPNGVLDEDEASANDTIAPSINTVTSSEILATSANVKFNSTDNTSLAMNDTVYYATQQDYTNKVSEGKTGRDRYVNKVGNPGYVMVASIGNTATHTVAIINIAKNVTYRYGVESCDVTGNCTFEDALGAGYAFTTSAGPAIASIAPSNGAVLGTYDSATITWDTDLSADSQVFYSASTSAGVLVNPTTAGSTAQVSVSGGSGYPHSVTISGLSSNATYSYKVRSTDRDSANVATYLQYDESSVRSFTTAAIPNPSPITPSCSVTDTTITVNWTTDQDTTTEISVLTSNTPANHFSYTAGAQFAQYPSFSTAYDLATWNTWRSSADYGKTHTNSFTGLTENTSYYLKAYSRNRSSGETFEFLTCKTNAAPVAETIVIRPPAVDTTPPLISIVAIKEVTADAVVIAWSTDELSDSLIEYGQTMNYGSISGSMKELVSAHSVTLSGLKPATNYNFKVSSADAKGNRAYAGDQSFTTMSMEEESLIAKDELEELKKQLEELKEKAESDAKKAATLQEAAKRFKEILKTISSDVSLQDLEELTTDISDTIEDITQQVIPPTIIGGVPSIEVGSDRATIKWRTNKPSSSLVALASEVDYNPKAQDPYIVQVGQPNEEVAEHTVIIPNLQSDTVYHFQIRSKAKVGPEGKSKDFVFETLPELPQIVDYSFKRIAENSITVVWKTNTLTTSLVRYTPLVNNKLDEENSKTQGKPDFVKDHEVTISNLPANTNFLIEISSSDVTGATASRTIGTVKTAIDVKAPVIAKVRSESTLFPGKTERTQTIIYWETDEPSTSQIFWKEGVGKGDFPNSTPIDKELTTSHVIVITTFKPGMVYRFQVESIDPTGNKTRSSDYTVLTPRKGETVIDLIITNFEDIFGFLKKL